MNPDTSHRDTFDGEVWFDASLCSPEPVEEPCALIWPLVLQTIAVAVLVVGLAVGFAALVGKVAL